MDTSKSYVKAGLYAGLIGAALAFTGSIPIINCLVFPIGCLGFFLIPGGAGFYASKLEGHTSNNSSEALQVGALAGLIAGVIHSTANAVLSIISSLILGSLFTLPLFNSFSDTANTAEATASAGFSMVLSIIFSFISIIVISIIYTVFGLLGGLIQSSMNSNTLNTPIKKDTTKPKASSSKNKSNGPIIRT